MSPVEGRNYRIPELKRIARILCEHPYNHPTKKRHEREWCPNPENLHPLITAVLTIAP
jgi:hypothetical protein